MIACLSPNGQNIRRGEASPTRLLVATLRGVNLLTREGPGASWIDRGRTLDGHHCGSLIVEPQRGGVFAGMHDGGLYFSPDGGETWEPRTRGLTYQHVFSLCYAHRPEGVVLYAGTGRRRCSAATTTENPGPNFPASRSWTVTRSGRFRSHRTPRT